jgi:hypothetical protein
MVNDVEGIVREVCGFSKIPDEDGDQMVEVRYDLHPINLSYLQKLFGINPNDSEDIVREVILCYNINKEQAAALQPYVIDGIIDLDKYDFMLQCYAKEK